MRILDRYIVREIFRHALLGLVVFTFVFFVPQLVRLMELLVRHAGSGGQLVKLFASRSRPWASAGDAFYCRSRSSR